MSQSCDTFEQQKKEEPWIMVERPPKKCSRRKRANRACIVSQVGKSHVNSFLLLWPNMFLMYIKMIWQEEILKT